MVLDDAIPSTAGAIMSMTFKVVLETLVRSDFFVVAALKRVLKCSFTLCKLRLFDYFCHAPTKNLHPEKVSINKSKLT